MSRNTLASTLPLPLSSGLFDDTDLDEQLRQLNEARSSKSKKGSRSKKNRGAVASSLEAGEEEERPPMLAAAAWATPTNNIPEKISRGRSSRLYL
jgi:hypothetical protein